MSDPKYPHPLKHRLTITSGAAVASIGLLLLVLLMGTANIVASYEFSQSSRNNLCAAFETVVHPPSVPVSSPLYQREEQAWQNWLAFSHRLGCPP